MCGYSIRVNNNKRIENKRTMTAKEINACGISFPTNKQLESALILESEKHSEKIESDFLSFIKDRLSYYNTLWC